MTALTESGLSASYTGEWPLPGEKRTLKTLKILNSDFRFRPEAEVDAEALQERSMYLKWIGSVRKLNCNFASIYAVN